MRRPAFAVTLACVLCIAAPGTILATTISFTAAQVKSEMAADGAPLNDATNQWGLWAVRAMPIVGGSGLYTIDSGSTTQTGWGVNAPNGAFGAAPYTATNSVWFWDASGAEVPGNLANPLYMIMDQPANTFTSYTFNAAGAAVESVPPNPIRAPGFYGGAGGTNVVTAVDDTSTFSFDFTLGVGATWGGSWQFVVDGSKYTLGTVGTPGVWNANFFGGYDFGAPGGPGGGLANNMGPGYAVPEPGSFLLFGSTLAALAGGLWRSRRRT